MSKDREQPGGRGGRVPYTRYRARRRLGPDREEQAAQGAVPGGRALPASDRARRGGPPPPPPPPGSRRRHLQPGRAGRRARALLLLRRMGTRKRILLGLLGLLAGWLALSALLFLASSHVERTPLQSGAASVLDSAGSPLTSANNILLLGSDRRQKNSREPGAEKTGYGRSDSIMLIRTGGGHSARLSIPRDTVVEIPGHGLEKINAAHAYGGPKESVEVIKRWLGVPIDHVIEVNFENFPALIDAMGGVDYTGGCMFSRLDGGFSQGGYTLRLPAGTHHIDGKQALAIARTRENLCARSQTDLNREEHQQALFNALKGRLLSFSSFLRLPWIAWNAPPAIISDMSGETLLQLFAAMAFSGTPQTRVLTPTGGVTLPGGGAGLTVSESARRAAVARFMSG
ncbi:MAG: LCP family protein [Solirubrobacteraceae bacterium]